MKEVLRREEIRMEDGRIVDLYLNRDETAIEETTRKYGKRLNRLAYSLLLNPEEAEECENDTYLSAWRVIPPNEPRSYLFAFLGKITRHRAINMIKQKNTQKRRGIVIELSKELEECIPAPSMEECTLSEKELGKIISDFLRGQKAEARGIFIRRYWFSDSIPAIASTYHISESKVKSMLFRIRNKLRIYLIKEGYDL